MSKKSKTSARQQLPARPPNDLVAQIRKVTSAPFTTPEQFISDALGIILAVATGGGQQTRQQFLDGVTAHVADLDQACAAVDIAQSDLAAALLAGLVGGQVFIRPDNVTPPAAKLQA